MCDEMFCNRMPSHKFPFTEDFDSIVPCEHRKSDSDLPYCNTIPCRNYIARTDTWKLLNGWRYVGPVENPVEPFEGEI